MLCTQRKINRRTEEAILIDSVPLVHGKKNYHSLMVCIHVCLRGTNVRGCAGVRGVDVLVAWPYGHTRQYHCKGHRGEEGGREKGATLNAHRTRHKLVPSKGMDREHSR